MVFIIRVSLDYGIGTGFSCFIIAVSISKLLLTLSASNSSAQDILGQDGVPVVCTNV